MNKSVLKRIALMMAMVLVFGMIGCSSKGNGLSFTPGTYTGTGTGKNGNVEVEVEFTSTEIKTIKVVNHNETEGIADAAIEQFPGKIINGQSTGVDSISGATLMCDAIIQAVEDCAKQADGDVEKLRLVKETNVSKEVEEVTTDIVVIGAGAAGSAAALAGVDNGAKVLLLEKTPSPMGAGTVAGGMFAADSKQQKENNAVVDKEYLYDKYMEASDGFMNSLLVRRIIDEAGPTVDWLEENGMELNLVDSGTGGGFNHIGAPATLHGYNEGGTVAITKLIETFKTKGGEVRFSTPATDLIKDADGNVVGVNATKPDGSKLKVNAKAVIVATGGFGGNDEMLKQYLGESYTKGEIAHNNGDGIKMAWDAGAAEEGIEVAQYFWAKFTDEETGKLIDKVGDAWYMLTNLTRYPNLRVNKTGNRFASESDVTLYSVHGAQISMQPDQSEYVIIDSKTLDKIKTSGLASIEEQFGKWKDGHQFFMEFNEPNSTEEFYNEEHTPTDYAALLDACLGSGVVFKSDSIDGLAKEIGVNENNFKSSVEQYNNSIKNGKDDLFFADTKRLVPVQEGPYYAVKFSARNLGTLGGVKINENIEVLDKNSNPIKGLYSAGADAGGMYGKAYVDFEGATLGFAYTSGRLSGINAANYVKQK